MVDAFDPRDCDQNRDCRYLQRHKPSSGEPIAGTEDLSDLKQANYFATIATVEGWPNFATGLKT